MVLEYQRYDRTEVENSPTPREYLIPSRESIKDTVHTFLYSLWSVGSIFPGTVAPYIPAYTCEIEAWEPRACLVRIYCSQIRISQTNRIAVRARCTTLCTYKS